jgi:hypothetical protein
VRHLVCRDVGWINFCIVSYNIGLIRPLQEFIVVISELVLYVIVVKLWLIRNFVILE